MSFKKAGFTPVPSDLVKPARVGESPVQLECKVNEVIELGDSGGAGKFNCSRSFENAHPRRYFDGQWKN